MDLDSSAYTSIREDAPVENMLLKVITLNCWGLKFISSHREQRIKSIAQHLKEQDYDIVFLQELWCQADFDHIKSTANLKFAHYFKTCSIAGTSGLAVFCRWLPDSVHFEPFLVNGSPFKPQHGDWYAGKGVGYARVILDQIRLHLFCTHLHAQYDDDEQISHQYSIHRMCQAYQLGKFINLATETAAKAKDKRDLIVLAGDLNTAAEDVPFRLLMSMTGLNDSCMHRYSHEIKRSIHGLIETEIEDDLITCGHKSNCYTMSTQKSGGSTLKDMVVKPTGKRIDFILYKLLQDSSQAVPFDESHHMCLADRVHCEGKDPVTGLSFSDHQPVIVKLAIKKKTLLSVTDQKVNNYGDIKRNATVQKTSATKNETQSVEERFRESQHAGDSFQRPRSNSNILLDMLPGRRPSCEETRLTTETKITSLSDMKSESRSFISESHALLRKYIEDSYGLKQKTLWMILVLMIFIISAAVSFSYVYSTSTVVLFQWWILSVGLGGALVFLTEMTFRLEHTAIKSIAEEMACVLQLASGNSIRNSS
ncbi:Sphingomyelin phosphodiesterase 2 [Halotydeus destructor]|nr:Sphingomyelin phosphodiesterase 2 [Halotydeus destructor]